MNFEDIKIKKAPLAEVELKENVKCDSDIIAKDNGINPIDYNRYISNNWVVKGNDNEIIEAISINGGAIWMTPKGEISYRFQADGNITTNTKDKAEYALSNYLGENIVLLKGKKADIYPQDLTMVQGEEFNPFKNREFFENDKGMICRNLFKPNDYMKTNAGKYNEPKAILKLISHLANDDKERSDYIVNWLAYFMQGLKKSQVSILLRGKQGAGKGILFNEVIKPLFNDEYCRTLDNESLQQNFKGALFEGKLFYNLDEVSHSNKQSNKVLKNFLKAIITNGSMALEKKFENTEKETKIYGQVLITSNEPLPIEIETSDRRFTVFTTGDNLDKVNYLGYKTYSEMSIQIKKEIKDFCVMLKSYSVDVKKANTALDTQEKRALVNATNDRFIMFVNAIRNKDIYFFEELEDIKIDFQNLYEEIGENFSKNRIKASMLNDYYKILYDDDKMKSKSLMNHLRAIDSNLFDKDNIVKSNGVKFYKIP